MNKNFIFTLVTILSAASFVCGDKVKYRTIKRTYFRDLKEQLSENPGQFGDTQHGVYHNYPIKAFRNL